MRASLDLFRVNVNRSRDLASIARAMTAQTTGALDTSDILRASLIMAVSSLDYFIHAIVRVGMLEAYRAERARTPAFLRFQVTLEAMLQASSEAASETWLDQQIRDSHGHQSFQTPDVAPRAWLENRRRTLVLGEVKHPRHQWHMEGEDDTNERIAAFNSYCRIASWDKPWQISRAMEVATPSSSKMLRVCSTISTDGWSPAISSCSA